MVRSSGLPSAAEPRRTVRLDERAVAAEPARVPDAAGEAPGAGHPITARRPRRPCFRRPSGPEATTARASPNTSRATSRRHIGGRHRAARALAEAPRGPAVGLGDLLDGLHHRSPDRPPCPPTERGSTIRNSRASCNAASTSGTISRCRSIRSACAAINGASSRARATQSPAAPRASPLVRGGHSFQHRVSTPVRPLWRHRPRRSMPHPEPVPCPEP